MSRRGTLPRPELAVRLATAADAAAIADVYLRSWLAGYEGLVSPARIEPVAEERAGCDWQAALEDSQSRFGVGLVGREVAGIAKVGPDPEEAVRGTWLELLYVVPERWGSGIASVLLHWALSKARASGETLVRLRVVEAQARARRFYEREGWKYDRDVPPSANSFFPLLCMRATVGSDARNGVPGPWVLARVDPEAMAERRESPGRSPRLIPARRACAAMAVSITRSPTP